MSMFSKNNRMFYYLNRNENFFFILFKEGGFKSYFVKVFGIKE